MGEPSTKDPNSILPEIRGFLANATRFQTSSSFLNKLSEKHLDQLLGISTGDRQGSSEEAVLISCLIKDACIKALSYKTINSVFFILGIALFLSAALWPVVAFVNGGATVSRSMATASGLIQTALFTAASACFALYLQYKRRQGQVEDALRRTLFLREGADVKVKRLIELAPAIDTGLMPPSLPTSAGEKGSSP